MLKKIYIVLFSAVFSLCFQLPVAASNDSLSNSDSSSAKVFLSGKTSIEEGQLRHSYLVGVGTTTKQMTPVWLNRSITQLRFDAYVGNNFHIIAAPEFRIWGNTYSALNETFIRINIPQQFSTLKLADAEGIYTLGGSEQNPLFQAAAGVFQFKYNNDAYNLGEYLFRTGCYTPYIITTFDRAYATLTGLRLSSVLLNKNLRQDVLLTTETNIAPLYDWSLSYLVDYKIPSLLDIGAGVSFNRLIPTENGLTTPKSTSNDIYIDKNGNTAYYTFQGTKLMGKISFDIKGLLSKNIASKFGKEDLKIFGEIAVLGIKNYEAYETKITSSTSNSITTYDTSYISVATNNYYKNRADRCPFMFGMNIPTFKILDVLSVQGEWFTWKNGNTIYSTMDYKKLIPIPFNVTTDDYPNAYKDIPWCWSVYAKKNFTNHIAAIGQIAHDHTFNEVGYEAMYCPVQVFNTKDGWGWLLKLEYAF